MKIDHICFYVDDASATRNWFSQRLGFRPIASDTTRHRHIEIVGAGSIYVVLCATRDPASPIAHYLQQHPPGVSDVAFCVPDIAATIARAVQSGAHLCQPLQVEQQPHGVLKWAVIAAPGDLRHTILERSGTTSLLPVAIAPTAVAIPQPSFETPVANVAAHSTGDDGNYFTGIDHVVLNVASGELERTIDWYEAVLGFQPQQRFNIQTAYSALCSRVMHHPLGFVQLPINEPASQNSQIQEFLDVNRGPGVQHIALETTDLARAIVHLRHQGLSLLHVPPTYYEQLRQRPGLMLSTPILQTIEQQQILVDWQDDTNPAVLLQTFTHPIFDQPTFFFELIQRCGVGYQTQRASGFGEGNFRALFEAIEREQIKRGSLGKPPLAQETAH